MAGIAGQITIARRVDEVFDDVAEQGPLGRPAPTVGRSGHFVRVVEYERPRAITSSTMARHIDASEHLTFEPVPDGTRLRWCGTVRPHGGLRLVGPVLTWTSRRRELRGWQGLKDRLEAAPPRRPRPPDAGRAA